MKPGIVYRGVFYDEKWYLFDSKIAAFLKKSENLADLPDKAAARDNLGVPSDDETATIADNKLDAIVVENGLKKSGTSGDGNLKFEADFATPAEAADPSVTDKVLAPVNVAQAVAEATRASAFNNITGLLPKSTESKFLMSQNANPAQIDYPEFSVVFNAEPFVRDELLAHLTVAAGTLTLPNSSVVTTHRVVLQQTTGQIVFQGALPDPATTNEIVLGSVVELNGQVFNSIIISNPWLASSDYETRINQLRIVSGGQVTPSATAGKVDMTAVLLARESINWEQSTSQPHRKTVAPTNPIEWTFLDRNGAILTADTDEVDGQHLDDGTTVVGNNNYSIQVAFIGSEGNIGVLSGQTTYSSLTDALAAVSNYNPVVPAILTTTLEFSRWVIKGDQYPGSGQLDLTDLDNFQVSKGADVEGGSPSVSASDVSSSNTSNDYTSTNLQEQLDEISKRTWLGNTINRRGSINSRLVTYNGCLDLQHASTTPCRQKSSTRCKW